jgi:hypothetical protein
VVELGPGDVDFTRLSACQGDAATGLYAGAMAAYVAWLAPRFDGIVQRFRERSVSLRDELSGSASHRRVPAMVGELLAAFDIFVEFCVEAGAVSSEESELIRCRCRHALRDSTERQEAHQAAADPVERFFSLVSSVISSGRGHVAATDGTEPRTPHDPKAWGWRLMDDGKWREQGRRIGWVDKDDLLLDPESAFAEANRLAQEQGDALGVSLNTLYKRLDERRLLVSTDPKRHTKRRMIEGVQRRVLPLRALSLAGSGQGGQSGQRLEEQSENGPLSWTALPSDPEKRSTKAVHNPAENGANGPLGPLSRTDERQPWAASDHEQDDGGPAAPIQEVF